MRVNGKVVKVIKVSKNKTYKIKLPKSLKPGKKLVRVTFVPKSHTTHKRAYGRTYLTVKRAKR